MNLEIVKIEDKVIFRVAVVTVIFKHAYFFIEQTRVRHFTWVAFNFAFVIQTTAERKITWLGLLLMHKCATQFKGNTQKNQETQRIAKSQTRDLYAQCKNIL